MIKLKYGNTNTFLLRGESGTLLIDTDYAGTLSAFFTEIKAHQIRVCDIDYVLATHYHPDHIGIISELMDKGVKLLLVDTQVPYVHFSDEIFRKEKNLKYTPINETGTTVICCAESREFLSDLGLDGEIISTPSHSKDSISVIMDNGDCFVGDLEPIDYLAAYIDNPNLSDDWERIMKFNPKRFLYAHANEKVV